MYTIILSELAGKKLDILLDYLELEWSVTVSDDFMDIFNQKLDQIAIYPESCKRSKIFFYLHQCVVTKQTSFLYRIKTQKLKLYRFLIIAVILNQ